MRQTFAQWLAEVDAILDSGWGVEHADVDLSEAEWEMAWERDCSPQWTANHAIKFIVPRGGRVAS